MPRAPSRPSPALRRPQHAASRVASSSKIVSVRPSAAASKVSLRKPNGVKATVVSVTRLAYTPQLLGHLDDFVMDSIGEKGLQVLHSVGEGATDETIEQSTQLKIAEIRSILNHLHSFGFVEYTREKNLQNGWFTYTWKLNADRAMTNFLQLKRRECDRLRSTLSAGDTSSVYGCRKGCSQLEFEKALEKKFKCEACKSDMRVLDQSKELRKVEEKISALEKLLDASAPFARP